MRLIATHVLWLTLLFAVFVTQPARACIWDTDTLAMERARFPEVNELIVGYFPRHSQVYYQWRLEKVLAKPVQQRSAADYDDLGVSYDKLGEHDKAIETMLAKIARFPNEGQYESQANLGTFYIHGGDFEKGLVHIGNAIEINPEAHFGREVYQKLLVEYVIEQRKAGQSLPLEADYVESFHNGPGFAAYVVQRLGIEGSGTEFDEVKRAIKGVSGMMRFGQYDSPILLEALGDLLVSQRNRGVDRLAARAYLRASYVVEDEQAREAYRDKARNAIAGERGVTLEIVEADLKQEIAEGEAYFAQIAKQEQAWIDAGKDLDAEFQAAYYDTPQLESSIFYLAKDRFLSMPFKDKAAMALFSLICLWIFSVPIRLRRRRRKQHATALV